MLTANWSWSLDGWIIAAGILAAVAAALLGNFLVLRRMSMLGDAISHAVLPGLAAAFFLSGTRNSLPMFLGAVIVGVMTALFTQWIRGVGKVDEGASMGVVFTSLFALGLVLIVQAADHVDLDPGCVLYGAIELTPLDKIVVAGFEVPRAVATLGTVAMLNALFVLVFYKELKLSSFDPALATTSGFNANLMHYSLMVLVAVTAVASFESVGNILVVAMFVVPPATAFMLTDRLPMMIGLSVVLAAFAAVIGHFGAVSVPAWFGYRSTTTAGMMAVATGVLLLLAVAFSPRHGVIVKWVRQRLLSLQILTDDVVALLYRREERDLPQSPSTTELAHDLLAGSWSLWFAIHRLRYRSEVIVQQGQVALTDVGRNHARQLVRSHRLWEQYLLSRASVNEERLHEKAEQFEHFTDRQMRTQLNDEMDAPIQDPHGSRIPSESEGEQ
ncbi:Manganese transport system membrane protein MntB [Novipirellula galeiformis]|uniref:Manganese transport system membrane protein MntB n=1 Tax=Novipirellula galeiformis TaxID=2528004 RepID=A0A5C6CL82_9BACT|nr:metal ABC transporter permease [Novipirellula galeiformis]TWU25370.1 Manganese transport system membrane protein MntB [Novipirellula galeiformis]